MDGVKGIEQALLQSLGNASESVNQAKKPDELGQSEFMKLLITQIKNQNPLSPEDPGAFLGQIAQFSQVDGIQKLNSSFASLSSSLQSNKALEASMLVGRKVLIDGNQADYEQGNSLKGSIEVPVSVSDLELSIKSLNGELIRNLSLGTSESGLQNFAWDGIGNNGEVAPSGRYQIEASATIDGKKRAFSTLISANVDSVTINQAGAFQLNLSNIGPVPMSAIRQVGTEAG